MKKSNFKWIALGTIVTGMLAFSAGMTYALNKIKKIQTEDELPEEGDDAEEETES